MRGAPPVPLPFERVAYDPHRDEERAPPIGPDFERAVPRAPSYAAAVFLSEPVTFTRIVGTILVVAGVVLISR